jgi:hypothetical protein
MDLWEEFCRQHDHHKGSAEYWQAYTEMQDKYRAISKAKFIAWLAKPEHERLRHDT